MMSCESDVYDPFGKQLEIIESIVKPVYIAHIISSYIGYIESTVDCEIDESTITSPPRPCSNEICLLITPPNRSKCKYVLQSVTIRLGYFLSWDFDNWPGDAKFNIKVELMDANNSTGKILHERLNVSGGGKDNQLIKCEMDLQLKCGQSYLFCIEQTDKQMSECEVSALVCKSTEQTKNIVDQRCFVKDVVGRDNKNNKYSVGEAWYLTKLTELVFYHK
eukprot:90186_1